MVEAADVVAAAAAAAAADDDDDQIKAALSMSIEASPKGAGTPVKETPQR